MPDVGVLQAGTMDVSTRCFDLLCFGKCTSESDLKLNIRSTGEAVSLITKDSKGEIVFREPKPMCTIQPPKGHSVWVNIELRTVTTKASDYMCLGIKKQSEDEFHDILFTGNSHRYVDIQEDDCVELIPLVSSTKLPTYTAVQVGDSAKIGNENEYDFGSVYRINITLDDNRCIASQSCDLSKINSNGWYCNGTIGVGPLICGEMLQDNQLLIINVNGQLARSSNGIHWTDMGNVLKGSESIALNNNWHIHPTFGNGVWCVINWNINPGVRRSIDYGKTWSETLFNIGARNLNFGDGVFMIVTDDGLVYTSPDAECWFQIGVVSFSGITGKILVYGDSKWIFGTQNGQLYYSTDGKGRWEVLSSNLNKLTNDVYGGCYANGYFYVCCSGGDVLKSSDGSVWESAITICKGCYNVISYKDKLYAFSSDGTMYNARLFSSDGII